MNKRAATVLAAMTAGVLAIAVVTVGGSAGQFGFGDDEGGRPAAAQEPRSVAPERDAAVTTTDYGDDDDDYDEHENDEESEGHDNDDDDDDDDGHEDDAHERDD
jgi:hypothetical protein